MHANAQDGERGQPAVALISPPGARTADSVALWWEPSESIAGAAGYAVRMDGRDAGRTTATDFTVTGLDADRFVFLPEMMDGFSG
jgi:hypothetical protein